MKNNHVNTFENFESNIEDSGINQELGNTDAFIYGKPDNGYGKYGKYRYDDKSNAAKREKYEAQGKKLYSIDRVNSKVVAVDKTGPTELAGFLKPETADKINQLGEQIQELVKLEKERFILHVKKIVLTQ